MCLCLKTLSVTTVFFHVPLYVNACCFDRRIYYQRIYNLFISCLTMACRDNDNHKVHAKPLCVTISFPCKCFFLWRIYNLLSSTDWWRSYRIEACHAECEVFPSSPPQLRFFFVFFFVLRSKRRSAKCLTTCACPWACPITKTSISGEPRCRFLSFFQGK